MNYVRKQTATRLCTILTRFSLLNLLATSSGSTDPIKSDPIRSVSACLRPSRRGTVTTIDWRIGYTHVYAMIHHHRPINRLSALARFRQIVHSVKSIMSANSSQSQSYSIILHHRAMPTDTSMPTRTHIHVPPMSLMPMAMLPLTGGRVYNVLLPGRDGMASDSSSTVLCGGAEEWLFVWMPSYL